ncbi:MAG: hypothetical protein ABI232_11820, partial [Jatrophihabitantaceae bacterium]
PPVRACGRILRQAVAAPITPSSPWHASTSQCVPAPRAIIVVQTWPDPNGSLDHPTGSVASCALTPRRCRSSISQIAGGIAAANPPSGLRCREHVRVAGEQHQASTLFQIRMIESKVSVKSIGRSGEMKALSAALLILAAAAILENLPDIARYFELREM